MAFQVPGRYELERIVWKDVQILYLPWSKSLHLYTTYQYSLSRDISKSNAVDEGESENENVCFKTDAD